MASSTQEFKTACAICPWACGLNVRVAAGKIAEVTGMKEHPMSKGYICPKASAAPETAYSPQRLKYPLKKVNGEWQRISWDEALDIIAEGLKDVKEKYGAKSFATMTGDATILPGTTTINMLMRFDDVYGTPNRFSPGSMCFNIRTISQSVTFGKYMYLFPDVENAQCMIIWGNNPTVSAPFFANQIMSARKRGMKLIVIDPRRTHFAKQADIYTAIRPGTDTALALGMMHTIISENLYDREFVENWTVGFDRLEELVQAYPPEEVEKITWVPAQTIREMARMFASTRPACIMQGINSLDQHRGGFQNSRAMAILYAITGNVERPGGLLTGAIPGERYNPLTLNVQRFVELLTGTVPGGKDNPLWLPELVEGKPLGSEQFPLFEKIGGLFGGESQTAFLPDTIVTGQPYPIKMMIIAGANPVVNAPNAVKFKEALKKLDRLVVFDTHMSETAQLADIVLPAATFLERTDLADFYSFNNNVHHLMLRKKTSQHHECWPDIKFWLELAKKMGYEKYFPWKDDEEYIDYALAPTGITVRQLEEENPEGIPYGAASYYGYKEKGFPTPSGKVEIYSERLAKWGYDPLPVYLEPESSLSTPELLKEYPLILITGVRMMEYYHSQFRDNARLRARAPEPLLEMHPATAKEYGINDGDMVNLETKMGAIEIKAKVTDDIARQVVTIPHGWAEANANALTDDTPCEPVCGYPGGKSMLCKIGKKG